jgi:hypothetical protein
MTRKLYGVLAWVLATFGALHCFAAFRIYSALTMSALWFFSGGLLIILGATLNLLNRAYGAAAPGLRIATGISNVVIAAVATTGGILSHTSLAQLVVVLALFVTITGLSWTRAALSQP